MSGKKTVEKKSNERTNEQEKNWAKRKKNQSVPEKSRVEVCMNGSMPLKV